jgi:cAMP-dependent protein kinase regulator
LPRKNPLANRAPRASVSAEAFGAWNKKSDFVPKVIKKSEEAKERIRTRLNQAFMFQALDEKEKNIVIDSMDEKAIKMGE